jgi:hypothetical protein
VGISLDSNKEKLLNFIKEKEMPWVQYFDGQGWKNKISSKYGIRSIPAMWLIDKKGNLVDKNARSGLEGKVEKLLAAKVSANTPASKPIARKQKPLTKEESAKVIEAAIRKAAKKPTGELTKADLEKVTSLLFRKGLTGVKGLEKLNKLTSLDLDDNKLTEVKGLEKLTQLTYLHLVSNKLTGVRGLENLTKLEVLYLSNNKLTEVKGLEKLTRLKELWLVNNQLTNVNGLENLTQLESLFLLNNPALTKAQIDELKKALPKCDIRSNPTK